MNRRGENYVVSRPDVIVENRSRDPAPSRPYSRCLGRPGFVDSNDRFVAVIASRMTPDPAGRALILARSSIPKFPASGCGLRHCQKDGAQNTLTKRFPFALKAFR